jgi:hypothetical protein
MRKRAAFALIVLSACVESGEDVDPPIIPIGTPIEDECTPEFAGFGGAPPVEFSHYEPPAGCMLDPVGREGSCDISGCSVPDIAAFFDGEEGFAPYLSCSPGEKPTGVDFSKNSVFFVRQGTRVGEWMKPHPVAWVIENEGRIIVAEKHRALCLNDGSLTGGVVSYAILLPSSTASTAIDRRVYRNPHGCDMCMGDNDCSE